MPLPTVEIAYLGMIHSPFSGQPAEPDDEPNEKDPTLLFAYYGDAGVYGYISPRLLNVLEDDGEETDPVNLAQGLQIDGGLVMRVDTDWNGVNYYGFAPEESKVVFIRGK